MIFSFFLIFAGAAALATLAEVSRRDVPAHCRQIGQTLQRGITRLAETHGVPVVCDGSPTHPRLRFVDIDPARTKTLGTLWSQEMARRGCHALPAFYLNASQQDAEIEQTLEAADAALTRLRLALDSGRPEDHLECPLATDSFRRLVS